MNKHQMQVKGSLSERAGDLNIGIEEAFVKADIVAMIDVSSSMSDMVNRSTRWELATKELEKIQEAYPGRVALLSFSSHVRFHPDGKPDHPSGMTKMTECLELARMADVPGMTFILISDGEPNNDWSALEEAKKFENKINTVFIGPDGDYGEQFLRDLAAATGGEHATSVRIERDLLSFAQRLLEAK